ncbi:hypothetical protein E4K62_12760 [Microbacterium wangchenii]|uniref:Uncharacterized protein n=1 Tax=Microbacterium wangchenii TaxID=2541726 RepID=A0ABX5SW39_9MICO|nr:hypothetical protein E4K62_12760 [Microbacterium wangchenii]
MHVSVDQRAQIARDSGLTPEIRVQEPRRAPAVDPYNPGRPYDPAAPHYGPPQAGGPVDAQGRELAHRWFSALTEPVLDVLEVLGLWRSGRRRRDVPPTDAVRLIARLALSSACYEPSPSPPADCRPPAVS